MSYSPNIMNTAYNLSLKFLDSTQLFGRCADIFKQKIELEKIVQKKLNKIQNSIDQLLISIQPQNNNNQQFILNQFQGIKQLFKSQFDQSVTLSEELENGIFNPMLDLINEQSDINQNLLQISRDYNQTLEQKMQNIEQSKLIYYNNKNNLFNIQNCLTSYNTFFRSYQYKNDKIKEQHENFEKNRMDLFQQSILKFSMLTVNYFQNISYDTNQILSQMKVEQEQFQPQSIQTHQKKQQLIFNESIQLQEISYPLFLYYIQESCPMPTEQTKLQVVKSMIMDRKMSTPQEFVSTLSIIKDEYQLRFEEHKQNYKWPEQHWRDNLAIFLSDDIRYTGDWLLKRGIFDIMEFQRCQQLLQQYSSEYLSEDSQVYLSEMNSEIIIKLQNPLTDCDDDKITEFRLEKDMASLKEGMKIYQNDLLIKRYIKYILEVQDQYVMDRVGCLLNMFQVGIDQNYILKLMNELKVPQQILNYCNKQVNDNKIIQKDQQ